MGHESVHAPAAHTWPGPQTVPQPPQLFTSLWRSRQAVPQTVWPGGQLTAQRPAEHT
jgi:hypothetical protein